MTLLGAVKSLIGALEGGFSFRGLHSWNGLEAGEVAVRKDPRNGQWRYRKRVRLPGGGSRRITGTPNINTKVAAEAAERAAIEELVNPKKAAVPKKNIPTFDEWFNGRFWREWVVSRMNKPSEQESKKSIYKVHLKKAFGDLPLDGIQAGEVSRFRAGLVELGLGKKTINNILAVLSKPLKYAEDARVIDRAPKVGILKAERPQIVAWDLYEYSRLLKAAKAEDEFWYVAVCLAGEAGLRVGEIRELDWKKDVDLVAKTISVNRQTRRGETGTPKGGTRRVVPMTETLLAALKALDTIRTGFVIRDLDGSPKSDDQTKYRCYKLCRLAGLPERGWHVSRHAFGTHAAMFGVNPWKLMTWMGHKRIDETMRYVHFAEAHLRPIPKPILEAGNKHSDPDRRILAMLSARRQLCCPLVAQTSVTPR